MQVETSHGSCPVANAADEPSWRRDFPLDIPADDALARREFTKFLVLTSGAFATGQCWIGAMSLLTRHGPYPEQPIVAEEQLLPGGVVEFRYPSEADPCLLIRLQDGRLVAYGQKCTHLACAVVPDVPAGRMLCPCHNASFELEQGRPLAGPPRRPLVRILLAVRGGTIYATGVELRTA